MTFLGYYLFSEGDRLPGPQTEPKGKAKHQQQKQLGSFPEDRVSEWVIWSKRLWTDFAINHRFIVFGSVALALDGLLAADNTAIEIRWPSSIDQVEQGERSVGAITTCNPLRRLLTTVE